MTLISILGDFHSSILPITFEFKEAITKHVVVYDDARADMENLKLMSVVKKHFLSHYRKTVNIFMNFLQSR